MRGLQQIKQIVHAKWSKSNGGQETANLSQEELTAEAEMILKRSQSMKHLTALSKYLVNIFLFRTQSCGSNNRLCQQDDCKVQQLSFYQDYMKPVIYVSNSSFTNIHEKLFEGCEKVWETFIVQKVLISM